jgi:hypothetical protein
LQRQEEGQRPRGRPPFFKSPLIWQKQPLGRPRTAVQPSAGGKGLRKNKYIKNKEVESINDENVSLNKAFNTVDKYIDYIIVFIFICLIWIMFINIYFSSNLAEDIDSYVKVYNHIKKNSLFCLFFIKIDYIVSLWRLHRCH